MKTKVLVAVLLGVFLLTIKLGNSQAETDVAGQTPLQSSYVCMVNNKYFGKEQIPVPYEGKTYYGCCKGCVGNLQNNRSVRYSVDPGTGKEVDKATAYIVMQPGDSGEVFYFESEASYKKYKEE